MIEGSFAVVRHPVARLRSVFRHHAVKANTIPPDWTLDDWLADWHRRRDAEPFLYDNHLLPQAEIVPPNAAVFPLEAGLDPVARHVDALAGRRTGMARIKTSNVSDPEAIAPERLAMSARTRDRVFDLYREDFARFGYDRENCGIAAQKMRPKPHFVRRLLGVRGSA